MGSVLGQIPCREKIVGLIQSRRITRKCHIGVAQHGLESWVTEISLHYFYVCKSFNTVFLGVVAEQRLLTLYNLYFKVDYL